MYRRKTKNVSFKMCYKYYKPKATVTLDKWLASSSKKKAGKCVSLTNRAKGKKPCLWNPERWNVVILDCTNPSTRIKVAAADVVPCPGVKEYLRDTRDDTWHRVIARSATHAELAPCFRPKEKG